VHFEGEREGDKRIYYDLNHTKHDEIKKIVGIKKEKKT